ncbi:MAG: GNAT family N-acetyltransferase [Candidatus Bathyarchaeota archaeon]|nr:GNAT family N-acetyltransferase [Candidatus Bathyarchaeota archaeon]
MRTETDSIIINKVTAQNFNDFIGLVTALAQYEKLSPPNAEAQARLRRDCLCDEPKFHAYIAQISGRSVGYITYFFNYSTFLAQPTLYIEDIFVLEEYRGSGVGKNMFGFLKTQAKDAGCGRIEFTVLKWNRTAQQFYEKNGAEQLEWLFYRINQDRF